MKHRSVDLEDRLEPVAGGLVGAEQPERAAAVGRAPSRRRGPASARPSGRVFSSRRDPGASTSHLVRVEARASAASSRSRPPLAYGVADIRRSPCGRQGRAAPAPAGPRRRRAARAGSDRSHSSSIRRCSGLSARPDSGTWWARNVPSTWMPSTTCGAGPALRRAQHDRRPPGPAGAGPARGPGRGLDRPDRVLRVRRAAYRAGNTCVGSSPATTTGAQPWLRGRPRRPRRTLRPRTVGPAIL